MNTDHRVILLNHGQHTIVDAEDFERLSKQKWWADWSKGMQCFYARGWVDGRNEYMHRVIVDCEGKDVDHINHNTLDNRKCNLRACTSSENLRNCKKYKNNSSGYKGVHFHRDRWVARIQIDGKTKSLGSFKNIDDAVRAYAEGKNKYYGEFAGAQ